MSVHRTARYAAYAAAALAVLIVVAALLVPPFLDTPAVEHEIQAKLSQLVQGEVAWEKLSIRLLPSPRGALTKVKAEIPGIAEVSADQVDARLRLLPLLRGRAEIASVGLSKPAIHVHIAPSAPAKGAPKEEAPADPVGIYRSIIEGVRRFAPEAELDIEDGELDLALAGTPPIRVRALELQGSTDSEGMKVSLSAASDSWRLLKAEANVAFADSSGEAKVELAGVQAQPWLDVLLSGSPVTVAVPETSLRLEARSDGKAKLEGRFGLRADALDVVRAAERVQLAKVAVDGTLAANQDEIEVGVKSSQFGSASLTGGSVRYGLKSGSLATLVEFDLDLAQAMDATRRLLPEDTGKSLARIQPVSGRAQGQAKFDLGRSGWNALVDIRKSDSAIGIEGLPGPVKVAAASINVTADATRIDGADVSMLDARAVASATIGYGKQLRIDGAVSQGSVGGELLAWVWKTAGIQPRLQLKTPVGIAVQRATWAPKRPLDLAATASFDSGPSVAVDLGWTPQVLDIRRAAIKDAKSDATLALHLEKGLAQGRFSGSLQSTTIGGALQDAKVPSGGVSGDLRFRIDLAHPGKGTAEGTLKADTVDLTWLLGRPVSVERVDVEADGQKLVIREASVNWAKQRFALSGSLTRAPDGAPVIDAKVESPGVMVDALLQRSGPETPAAAREPEPTEKKGELWTLWPLPVRGNVAFRTDFVQYGERKATPVVAALALEDRRARFELREGRLCGISFPLTVDGTQKNGFDIAVKLAADKQQLEETARCLTEKGVLITGEFDLNADIRANVRTVDWVNEMKSSMNGPVTAESRNGRVMKFALLGNILAMQNVAAVLKEGAKLDEKGFPYRRLLAAGRFENGRFLVDKGALVSDAVGLAATGRISIEEGYQSDLNVLVAPLGMLNELISKIPLLGDVGAKIVNVPVRVSGDIRDPRVVPLGLRAVGSQVFDILEETAKVPAKLLPRPPATP